MRHGKPIRIAGEHQQLLRDRRDDLVAGQVLAFAGPVVELAGGAVEVPLTRLSKASRRFSRW